MNARSKIVFATEYDDARDTAKLTRDLSPEDFLALPRFHAYANLVADGHPSGWALIRTLPPPPATADPDQIRAVSRAKYAAVTSAEAIPVLAPDGDKTEPAAPPAAPPAVEKVGRKRRQR
jgi:hypothetical protein